MPLVRIPQYGAGVASPTTFRLYRGPPYSFHRGYGLFGDAFRRLIPILTQRVMPYIVKRLYETGIEVMDDVSKGTTWGLLKKLSGSG